MRYKILGNYTGLRVSEVALGTGNFQIASAQASYLVRSGFSQVHARILAFGSIERELVRQAYLQAYADVYFVISCLCALAAVLTVFLDSNDPNANEAKGE